MAPVGHKTIAKGTAESKQRAHHKIIDYCVTVCKGLNTALCVMYTLLKKTTLAHHTHKKLV